MTDMEMIRSGDIEILYSHPEAMFTPVLSRILRSKKSFSKREEDFRPKFKQIGELTALFPNAAHLAVTATATPSSIQFLSKTLQYINPTIIQVNPDRPNLFLEIKNKIVKPREAPTTLEKYFQEVGRAGRKGQKAEALMYFNNNDLAKNRKGLSDAMVQYCKTRDKCLRLQLLQYFGFNEAKFNGPMYECCSYCRQLQ
ncbi:recQ [Mytilus coruscus]|uniref:DNA 3'-5' helicase n=1 Tax=Mytilus coruscus TaxID=42192 RepID=A0A6J8E3D1_MYTCO|nr:recQ [Mytilus coruscus]